MTTKQKSDDIITIAKEEYEALLHTAKVTSEYLSGNSESFDSVEDLIASLKSI
ncbi:hypothetical protein K9M41_03260 [Candidatus Gracilibacteria bacterium]|nr:hypothetical protein [Candidatus Gracilibacteria bacterium]